MLFRSDRNNWVKFVKTIPQPETPGKNATVKIDMESAKLAIGNDQRARDALGVFLCEEFEGRSICKGEVKSFNLPKES